MAEKDSTKRLYMITYDLNTESYDYTSFFNKIKSFGENYHPLERMWVVFSEKSKDTISSDLRNLMNQEKDRLFVAEVKPELSQGWLGSRFWQWYNSKKG